MPIDISYDVFYHHLYKFLQPNDLFSMLLVNRFFFYTYATDSFLEQISKFYLKKYKVEFWDKGNLIYHNSIAGNKSYYQIFLLYYRHFKKTELDCYNQGLTSIPYYPNLEHFDFSYNKIMKIPVEYAGLVKLNCANNKISSLPSNFSNLRILICDRNFLTEIPAEYVNLKELYCRRNQISILPDSLIDLTILDCRQNSLSIIPDSYIELKRLVCGNNRLNFIQPKEKLTILHIDINNIQEIVIGNFPMLKELYCRGNRIKPDSFLSSFVCKLDQNKFLVSATALN